MSVGWANVTRIPSRDVRLQMVLSVEWDGFSSGNLMAYAGWTPKGPGFKAGRPDKYRRPSELRAIPEARVK
ncbi:MAG: hypothetical protein VX700_03740 [Pseudomonadota bacterium]|nr:hypothetical protein [Pseudomonadota bacterium]